MAVIRWLFLLPLLTCLGSSAEDNRDVLITVRRAGVIEFADPKTLLPISQLQIDIPINSTGLNGILASADGSALYIEGPTAPDEEGQSGCCYLYSIDLATLHTKMAAGIGGSPSRGSLLITDRSVYPLSAAQTKIVTDRSSNDVWRISPNGRWLLSINRQQHVVTVYDLLTSNNVRHFQIPDMKAGSWLTGAWSSDKFYLYAVRTNNEGRLWTISPDTTQLNQEVAVPATNVMPDCRRHLDIIEITAAGKQLFVYEVFGLIGDRRIGCSRPVVGGASIIDSQSGQLLNQIAPELHFSMLIPNRDGSELYGLTDENLDSSYQSPAELVRIDAHTGRVLQSRFLDGDYWRIAVAKVSTIPASHKHITLQPQ